MISACGMKCDACPIFRAANDFEFAKELAEGWPKDGNTEAEAGWFKCQGCHGSEDLLWGKECAIRDCCVKEKELENCSLCSDFPCAHVTSFESDGHPHHKMAVERLRAMRAE